MTVKEEMFRSIQDVKVNVALACQRSKRTESSVEIVAVSKKQSLEKMKCYAEYCARYSLPVIYGESYVQEFRNKKNSLSKPFEVHLIGKLQSNKAKDAVFYFDVIQSVHSEKLAQELDKEAGKLRKKQKIFIQVNISNDQAKNGFTKEKVEIFLRDKVKSYRNLELNGLMTITKDYALAEEVRADYRDLRLLRDKLKSELSWQGPLKLSMGMSNDYEIAIEEGADVVRIGTALFGAREDGS
jgi:pyridoxal phosphate enzyme (YggS family)